MTQASTDLSQQLHAPLPFQISHAGELCLDFVNTLNWRTAERPIEMLDDYADLVRWAFGIGIAGAEEALDLLARAQARSDEAQAVLRSAIALREAIYGVFAAVMRGEAPAAEEMAVLNEGLAQAAGHLRVAAGDGGFGWRWAAGEDDLDRMLWPIARSAAGLLTSDRLERVGQCGDADCGWLFLDTSRNHTRRWCDMKDCGNRAKARRHYQRTREGRAAE